MDGGEEMWLTAAPRSGRGGGLVLQICYGAVSRWAVGATNLLWASMNGGGLGVESGRPALNNCYGFTLNGGGGC